MDENSIAAFGKLFSRPGWLIATFVLPWFLPRINNIVKYYARQVFGIVDSSQSLAENKTPLDDNAAVLTKAGLNPIALPGIYHTAFLKVVHFLRPLLTVFLAFYVLALAAAYFLTKQVPGIGVACYFVYFLALLLYNIGEFRKERSRPYQEKWIDKLAFLRMVVLPITYAHILAFLYLLIHQSFFSLLSFSTLHSRLDTFTFSLLLLIFPITGVIVVKDLLYPGANLLSRLLAYFLCCCIVAFCFLTINLYMLKS